MRALALITPLKVAAVATALSMMGCSAVATEEPPFTMVSQNGSFEIRDYPGLVAAEVSVPGDQKEASNSGFRLLAGYIFGDNTSKTKIAMTAPVVQAPGSATPPSEKIAMTAPVTQSRSTTGWTVRFIMPAGSTLETLPTPNNPKVSLVEIPPARFAVLRFSGLASPADVAEKTATLKSLAAAANLTPTGPAALAQYDPPWTPWFMRRNEVMLPVTR